MNFTDTHCHLNASQFEHDRPSVLERARARRVVRILVPGLTLESSRQITAWCETAPELYAAVGVHPTEALTWRDDTLADLQRLAAHPKVKAIGEIGLDYYWDTAPPSPQKDILRQQLDLAAAADKPVVLHCRDKDNALDGPCITDLLSLLDDWTAALRRDGHPLAERPGVIHSFSSSLAHAQSALQMGFFIGVTGPVTFKNARTRQEIIRALPLESLLIETDAPYLAPHPHRGQRNEPAYVVLIAGKIAELHDTTMEKVAAQTSANAERLFSWRA